MQDVTDQSGREISSEDIWKLFEAEYLRVAGRGGAVCSYLADGDPRKRFELADRLARFFDRCLLYRPDWIRQWEGGAPH